MMRGGKKTHESPEKTNVELTLKCVNISECQWRYLAYKNVCTREKNYESIHYGTLNIGCSTLVLPMVNIFGGSLQILYRFRIESS